MSGNKTSKAQCGEKKILLLSVILGMSANALLSSVRSSVIPFSIFPLIALVLSAQMLYQYYLLNPVAEDIPLIGLACFFIGAFGHAALFICFMFPSAPFLLYQSGLSVFSSVFPWYCFHFFFLFTIVPFISQLFHCFHLSSLLFFHSAHLVPFPLLSSTSFSRFSRLLFPFLHHVHTSSSIDLSFYISSPAAVLFIYFIVSFPFSLISIKSFNSFFYILLLFFHTFILVSFFVLSVTSFNPFSPSALLIFPSFLRFFFLFFHFFLERESGGGGRGEYKTIEGKRRNEEKRVIS